MPHARIPHFFSRWLLIGSLCVFSASAVEAGQKPPPQGDSSKHWTQLHGHAFRCALALVVLERARLLRKHLGLDFEIPLLDGLERKGTDFLLHTSRKILLEGELRNELIKALKSENQKDRLLDIALQINILTSHFGKTLVQRKLFKQLRKDDILGFYQLIENEADQLSDEFLILLSELFHAFSELSGKSPLSETYETFARNILAKNKLVSSLLHRSQLLDLRNQLQSLDIDRWLVTSLLLSEEIDAPHDKRRWDLALGAYSSAKDTLQYLWKKQTQLDPEQTPYISLKDDARKINLIHNLLSDLRFWIIETKHSYQSTDPDEIEAIEESMRLREPALRAKLSEDCARQFEEALKHRDMEKIEMIVSGEFIFLESLDPILDLINAESVDRELRSKVLDLIRRYDWSHWH